MVVLCWLVVIILSQLILYLFVRVRKAYRTWQQLNIPYLPASFPFGNFVTLVTKRLHFNDVCRNLYNELKQFGECTGIYLFQRPVLFVTGPDFAKTILVRDFNYFTDRGLYYNVRDDPLSGNLFFYEGNEWKALRQKFSFAFTSGKMKMMFQTLSDVGEKLVASINRKIEDNTDVRELMACFTTDVISSCVFGLDGDCLENEFSDLRRVGGKVMTFSKLRNIAIGLATTYRDLARKLHFQMFDKKSTDFFYQMVNNVINYRQTHNVQRNDLMQIMIEMLKVGDLTLDDIVGNAFVFFFAGFETSSTTLTFILYLLATNQDAQEKARAEIDELIGSTQLTYEKINQLQYLEQIIQETLRLYPIVGILNRITNQPYTLPNGSTVPTETMLLLPILGFHYDSSFWPEPEKFIPERFAADQIRERHHYIYLPFGEGQRICIGQRFAMLQIKVALVNILRNFSVNICQQTEIPIRIDYAQAVYVPDGKVWLKFSSKD